MAPGSVRLMLGRNGRVGPDNISRGGLNFSPPIYLNFGGEVYGLFEQKRFIAQEGRFLYPDVSR